MGEIIFIMNFVNVANGQILVTNGDPSIVAKFGKWLFLNAIFAVGDRQWSFFAISISMGARGDDGAEGAMMINNYWRS